MSTESFRLKICSPLLVTKTIDEKSPHIFFMSHGKAIKFSNPPPKKKTFFLGVSISKYFLGFYHNTK